MNLSFGTKEKLGEVIRVGGVLASLEIRFTGSLAVPDSACLISASDDFKAGVSETTLKIHDFSVEMGKTFNL